MASHDASCRNPALIAAELHPSYCTMMLELKQQIAANLHQDQNQLLKYHPVYCMDPPTRNTNSLSVVRQETMHVGSLTLPSLSHSDSDASHYMHLLLAGRINKNIMKAD